MGKGIEDFVPSMNYIVMPRERFNELKQTLERIRSASNAAMAADFATNELESLKLKYDEPTYAEKLKAHIEKQAKDAAAKK